MTESVDDPAPPALPPVGARPLLVLLGTPHVRTADGRRLKLERRDAGLLAWLAVHGETPRTRLIELLWPGTDAESARNTLRQRLFQLRKRCGFEVVRGAETIALGDTLDVDFAAVQRATAAAGRASETRTDTAAADPGAGQPDITATAPALLDGCDYPECAAFSEWLAAQREKLAQARRDALVAQAEAAEREGRLADALRLAQSLLALDPLHEHGHRRVMRLHYLRGDRAAALAAFDRCERLLKDELSAAPGAETLALLKTIDSSGALPAVTRRAPLPATILRPPRLIGRARDLDAMRTAWDSGRVFLVTGEAGMGKTRLLSEFAAEVRGAVHVQARPGDAGIPYASLARLLRALIERAPQAVDPAARVELARVLPELGDGAPMRTGRADVLQQAIESVLRRAHDAGVGALLLDDLHFADDSSIELVLALASAEPAAESAGAAISGSSAEPAGALRWGLAQRPGETGAAARALRDGLEDAGRLQLVALAPLDAAQIAELVDSLGLPGLGGNLSGAALGAMLRQHTGGNPLFVLETLKQLGDLKLAPAGAGAALPKPVGVGQLIERRLRQLSPQALALVRLAAVAGVDFSVPLAEELLGVRALEIADAWQELEAAHVFRGEAFAHDLVYETALASVPQAVAQRLHAQIAERLEAHGGDVERVAQHWTNALHAERAVPMLRAAARAALDKFQRPTAVAHLERAVAFLQDLQRRDEAFELQQEIVLLLQGFDTGERHEAALATLRALAATPAQRAQAHIAQAVLRIIQGRYEDALAPLDLAQADATPESRELSEVLNVRGNTLRRLGRIDESLQSHRAAVALVRRLGTIDDLAGNLNNLALTLLEVNDAAQAAVAFEESARLERDPMTRARVLNNLAIALEESGQPAAALETRQSSLALLRGQDGTEFVRANVLIALAGNARAMQHYAEALAWLDEAEAIGLPPTHWRASSLHCQRALVWIELGAWSLADQAIERAEATSAGSSDAALGVLLVRLTYEAARGMDAAALLGRLDVQLRHRTDRRTLRPIVLRRLPALPPPQAVAAASRELEYEATCGNRAAQIAFATAIAQAELARGDAGAALAAARRANEAMRSAAPTSISALEVRFTLFEALQAGGEAAAGELIGQVHDELQRIAQQHVPQAHRQTFLRGVRLNRRIAEAYAARRGLPGGRRAIARDDPPR